MQRTITPGSSISGLYSVRASAIWQFLLRQPAAYWWICFYLFVEYVRIQAAYPALDVVRWGLLAIGFCTLSLFLGGRGFNLRPVATKALLALMAIVLATGFTAYAPDAAWQNIDLPMSWLLVYLLITGVVNTEGRFFVFMLSFLLYSMKMSLHSTRSWAEIGFQFRNWGTTGAPGWFQNSGEFGIQMAVFLPLACYFMLALWRHWPLWKRAFFALMPTTAIIGMVASSSRGALLGGAAAAVWMVMKSRYRMRGTIAVVGLAAAVYVIVPQEQKTRFANIGEDSTSESRLTYWRHGLQIAREHPLLGIGYNNWRRFYGDHFFGNYADPDRPARLQLPHNLFIECVAELGFLGFCAFLGLIAVSLTTNGQTRRTAHRITGDSGRFFYYMAHGLDAALIGYLVSGSFVTVFWYPYFWINLAMTVSLNLAARTRLTGVALQTDSQVRR